MHKEGFKRKKAAHGDEGITLINTGDSGAGSKRDVLNVDIEEDLVYRPRTKETRAIYE